jgi:hypothetical protein
MLVASSNRGVELGTETLTQAPKKIKMPLDYALRCMHDAMEMVFDYDHDPNFVPSTDQLVLFEMLHKQIVGYSAMSLIILKEMHERARLAMSAAASAAVTSRYAEEGSE